MLPMHQCVTRTSEWRASQCSVNRFRHAAAPFSFPFSLLHVSHVRAAWSVCMLVYCLFVVDSGHRATGTVGHWDVVWPLPFARPARRAAGCTLHSSTAMPSHRDSLTRAVGVMHATNADWSTTFLSRLPSSPPPTERHRSAAQRTFSFPRSHWRRSQHRNKRRSANESRTNRKRDGSTPSSGPTTRRQHEWTSIRTTNPCALGAQHGAKWSSGRGLSRQGAAGHQRCANSGNRADASGCKQRQQCCGQTKSARGQSACCSGNAACTGSRGRSATEPSTAAACTLQ